MTENNGKNIFDQENQKKIMSTSEWAATILITGIPLVGFIMLIVWALGDDSNPNRKNYAKASLIIMVVVFALVIFLYASIFATIIAALNNSGGY